MKNAKSTRRQPTMADRAFSHHFRYRGRPIACGENGCLVRIEGRDLVLLWHQFEYSEITSRFWIVELSHWLVVQLDLPLGWAAPWRPIPYRKVDPEQERLPLRGGRIGGQ